MKISKSQLETLFYQWLTTNGATWLGTQDTEPNLSLLPNALKRNIAKRTGIDKAEIIVMVGEPFEAPLPDDEDTNRDPNAGGVKIEVTINDIGCAFGVPLHKQRETERQSDGL